MKAVFIVIIAFFIFSCSSKNREDKKAIEVNATITESKIESSFSTSEVDSLTNRLDSLLERNILVKYHYPDKSMCGGSLYGYFQDSTLLVTTSTFFLELGFTKRKVYWHDERIIKIIHHRYLAEWGKYEEKYPHDKFEWDESKMTYTDTVYSVNFGDKKLLKKMANNKTVYVAQDTVLLNEMIRCAFRMKEDLKTQKVLENNQSKPR